MRFCKLKGWFLSIFLSSFSIFLYSQQLPIFSQYGQLATFLNPGAIPSDYYSPFYEYRFYGSATVRDQWQGSGLSNPPSTQLLRLDYLTEGLFTGEETGLITGLQILHDRNGIFETTGVYGKIAGVIGTNAGQFSVGLNLGVLQNRLNFKPSSKTNVGTTPQGETFSGIFPDVGFGIYYKHDISKGLLYSGISVPQVFGFNNGYPEINRSVKRIQHFYYSLGMVIYKDDHNFIEPSIWVKYVPNAPINIDLSLRIMLANTFWLRPSISTESKIVSLDLGLLKDFDNILIKFSFGFSYPFTEYGSLLGGTQEYHFSTAF